MGFSDEQKSELPFPLWDVSNGEWSPRGPSAKQRAAARLLLEEADTRARRLGMSRRDFLRTAAGTATAFMVLNLVNGLPSTGGLRRQRDGGRGDQRRAQRGSATRRDDEEHPRR